MVRKNQKKKKKKKKLTIANAKVDTPRYYHGANAMHQYQVHELMGRPLVRRLPLDLDSFYPAVVHGRGGLVLRRRIASLSIRQDAVLRLGYAAVLIGSGSLVGGPERISYPGH